MGARKHFLDWLPIIAFGLLTLSHTGMLYVSWPYNLKSPRLVPGLEWVMDAVGPWRMPLLFTISSVASRFLIERLGPGRFALDRLARLLPVILIGMFVIVPPQTYVELVAKRGLQMSYSSFWFGPYLHADQTLVRPLGKTLPTWDHLWFLVYLLNYALLFAAAFAVGRRLGAAKLSGAPAPAGLMPVLMAPGLWMATCNVLMLTVAPFTHALVTEWAAHLKWLGLSSWGRTWRHGTEFGLGSSGGVCGSRRRRRPYSRCRSRPLRSSRPSATGCHCAMRWFGGRRTASTGGAWS